LQKYNTSTSFSAKPLLNSIINPIAVFGVRNLSWSSSDINDVANNVYRRSLDLLADHIRKVQEAVRLLVNSIDDFALSKSPVLHDDYHNISKVEEEADIIKRELIEQLTKAAPSFMYREDFLRLIVKNDEIAELVQSLSRLIARMADDGWSPDPVVADGFKTLAAVVLTTFERLRDTIMALSMNPHRAIELVRDVHDGEAKVDEISQDLEFKLLKEVKQYEKMLIFRELARSLEQMTDLMEDASDDARVLALHRVA